MLHPERAAGCSISCTAANLCDNRGSPYPQNIQVSEEGRPKSLTAPPLREPWTTLASPSCAF